MTRKAQIYVHGVKAALLVESASNHYVLTYEEGYRGGPVSLALPIENKLYTFSRFPAFFEGLLPEGVMLESLLRLYKLDRNDLFGQLIQVGHDLVGAITVEPLV